MSLQSDDMIIVADSDWVHAVEVLQRYGNVVKLQTIRKLMLQVIQNPGDWDVAGRGRLEDMDHTLQAILADIKLGELTARAKLLAEIDQDKDDGV